MSAPSESLALLLNPTAGGGRATRVAERAGAALDAAGAVYRVRASQSAEHLAELTRTSVAAGQTPVAVGGDGTLAAVAREVAGQGVAIGLLPAGRGNDFARVVGIPTDPAAAASVLLDGDDSRLDLGEANGHIFLGIASFGFDSDANRIANESRAIKGSLVYLYAGLRAALGWRSATFRIRADGYREREMVGWTVAIANSKAYGGGMFIAPDASLTDGCFELVTISGTGKLRFLAGLPKVFKGTHVQNDEVEVVRTREVEVDASRSFDVYADGDRLTQVPVKARVLPGALVLRTPKAQALA